MSLSYWRRDVVIRSRTCYVIQCHECRRGQISRRRRGGVVDTVQARDQLFELDDLPRGLRCALHLACPRALQRSEMRLRDATKTSDSRTRQKNLPIYLTVVVLAKNLRSCLHAISRTSICRLLTTCVYVYVFVFFRSRHY